MTNLRMASVIAYERQRQMELEDRRQLQKEYRQFAHACFVQTFGTEPDGLENYEDGVLVSADGITFIYDPESNVFNLWAKCRCGEPVVGQRVYSLESLGNAVTNGLVPRFSHNCQSGPTPEPNPMLTALQSIAAELKNIAAELETANGKNF